MKYSVVCFRIRRRFFYLLLSSVFLTYLSAGSCTEPNERYNAILIFCKQKRPAQIELAYRLIPILAHQLCEIIDPLSYALSVPVFYFVHSIQRIPQSVKYNLSFCICAFLHSFSCRSHGNVKWLRPNVSDGACYLIILFPAPENLRGNLGRCIQN